MCFTCCFCILVGAALLHNRLALHVLLQVRASQHRPILFSQWILNKLHHMYRVRAEFCFFFHCRSKDGLKGFAFSALKYVSHCCPFWNCWQCLCQTHRCTVLSFFSIARFIIGKEEIPTHPVTAEQHIGSRPLERAAAIETEESRAAAERPRSRRTTLLAYTRQLLESMWENHTLPCCLYC